jgi:hypothetical protein
MDIYWSNHGEVILYSVNSDKQIKKMYKIAKALNAKLQGDDGEIYNADGTDSATDQQEQLPKKGSQSHRPKRFINRFGYLLIFAGIIGSIGTRASHFHFSTVRIMFYAGCIILGLGLLFLSSRLVRKS